MNNTKCKKQQINEETHDKQLKEFNNKVPCPFGNDNCSCTYIIKNKKVTRSEIFKLAIIHLVAKKKKELLDPLLVTDQINQIKKELKIGRDLLNYDVEIDIMKLAENLFENYKNANLNRIERENEDIKNSDRYIWNQLTKSEKGDWILSATMISFNYLILTKNSSSDVLLTNNSEKVYNNIDEKKTQGGI